MKPSFHARPVNGPFDDPGLYIRILREGRAIMFDLGFTTALSSRDILKTTDIFVTHTHIDHFIGFDNILRVSLKKEGPVRLYGPEGFTSRVEGKLGGYSWNLIGDYPLIIETAELSGGYVRKSAFRAQNHFRREDIGEEPFAGTLMNDDRYSVSAAVVDHRIPCLAFALEEDYHINIDKSLLGRLGLPVGPWLRELKTAIRENKTDAVISVNGKDFAFRELEGIANITRGQKLSYVMDALGSEDNISRIVGLVKGSDVLYIETFFLDADISRARDRYHLTAREAGRIAGEAGVGRIEPVHFSPRYTHDPDVLIQEAEEEFRRTRY